MANLCDQLEPLETPDCADYYWIYLILNSKFYRATVNVMQFKMDFVAVHHGILLSVKDKCGGFMVPTFRNSSV